MENTPDITTLKDYIEEIRIAMISTKHEDHLHSRPMATAQVDDEGNLWFFTNEFSEKADQVSLDPHVVAAYADPSKNKYISVRGNAELVDDREKMKELFNPMVKAWFPDGLDDPKLTLLKITTTEAEYWDGSSSKIVSLFHTLKAVFTGQKSEEGKHGELKV